jgi:hypothetical protein
VAVSSGRHLKALNQTSYQYNFQLENGADFSKMKKSFVIKQGTSRKENNSSSKRIKVNLPIEQTRSHSQGVEPSTPRNPSFYFGDGPVGGQSSIVVGAEMS